jgi:hypothetical protein
MKNWVLVTYMLTMTTGTMKDVNNIAETIKNSKNSYNINQFKLLKWCSKWGTDSPPLIYQ